MAKIKAVLFDLGGTLIETGETPEIYRRILGTSGIVVSCKAISEAHDATRRELDPARGQCELGMDFWIKWNSRILHRLGVSHDVDFLAHKITESWWDYADVKLYPDALQTLTTLRGRGIKLGVVTNSLRADYEQLVNRLNIAAFFDAVVGTDSCKSCKPEKAIFMFAVNKLGVRPEEALFIGNEFQVDYEGAKEAGLKALLIERDERIEANMDKIDSLEAVLRYLS